jgi:hypothetical protein
VNLPLVPGETVACVVCGTVIAYARSRLFWVSGGTVRTCKRGLVPHAPKGGKP